jgi:hypothetical protein
MADDMSSVGDPISPELALVDPELADRARRDLAEHRERLRRERRLAAAPATPETPLPAASAPRLIYMPRPARTRLPAPPAAAPVAVATRRRSTRWSRRGRTALALFVVYALVGWIAFRVARHELRGHPAADIATSPGAEAEAPTPTGSEPKIPAAITRTARPRTFVWLPVRGSTFYEIRIFRNDREIFEARTRKARLTLPRTWRYGGTSYRLKPGAYRWLVLPGFGTRTRPRYGAAVVSATLRVGR